MTCGLAGVWPVACSLRNHRVAPFCYADESCQMWAHQVFQVVVGTPAVHVVRECRCRLSCQQVARLYQQCFRRRKAIFLLFLAGSDQGERPRAVSSCALGLFAAARRHFCSQGGQTVGPKFGNIIATGTNDTFLFCFVSTDCFVGFLGCS